LLADYHRQAAEQNRALWNESARLLGLLSAMKIDALLFHEAYLSAVAFPAGCVRDSGTIDILLPPAQTFPAIAALQRDGYETVAKLTPREYKAAIRLERAVLLFKPGGHAVELHWGLAARRSSRLWGELWATRTTFFAGEAQLACPRPEHMLVALCLRGLELHWKLLQWAVDFAALAHHPVQIHRETLLRFAERAAARGPLLLGLQFARLLGGEPLPEPLEKLPGQERFGALARHILREMPTLRPITKTTRDDFRLEMALAGSAAQKGAVGWRFLMTPSRADWQAFRWLPPRRGFIAAVRPLRLAASALGLRTGSGAMESRRISSYAPTPGVVLDRILALAELRPGDVLYDLGSGDGRIVVEAALRHGVRAVGIELDPGLVARAQQRMQQAGVGHLVRLVCGDAMAADVSEATVVVLYLPIPARMELGNRLTRQLRQGARIVTHGGDTGEWDRAEVVKAEGYLRTVFVRVVA
jgi:hypothetical protein